MDGTKRKEPKLYKGVGAPFTPHYRDPTTATHLLRLFGLTIFALILA
ncbi:MAG: hypothetical protein M3M86_07390 [Thermoproteota archaeon]|nr:hypothetical protein [Thermoproteota archaeon]